MLSYLQVEYLISRGACILATTYSDNETAREKCEMDEEGYDGTSKSLYSMYHHVYYLHNTRCTSFVHNFCYTACVKT